VDVLHSHYLGVQVEQHGDLMLQKGVVDVRGASGRGIAVVVVLARGNILCLWFGHSTLEGSAVNSSVEASICRVVLMLLCPETSCISCSGSIRVRVGLLRSSPKISNIYFCPKTWSFATLKKVLGGKKKFISKNCKYFYLKSFFLQHFFFPISRSQDL